MSDVEHYKALSEANAEQTCEEALCFIGEHTHALIMEISGQRCKMEQLEASVEQRLAGSHMHAITEYRALVDQLFSASLSIKNRFQEYR